MSILSNRTATSICLQCSAISVLHRFWIIVIGNHFQNDNKKIVMMPDEGVVYNLVVASAV